MPAWLAGAAEIIGIATDAKVRRETAAGRRENKKAREPSGFRAKLRWALAARSFDCTR